MPTTTTGLATSFITFSRPGATGGGATVTLSNGRIGWAGHNLLLASESFDSSSWTKDGVTTTANSVAAPNATTTADAIMETATTGAHGCIQKISGDGSVEHTIRAFVKGINRTWVYFASVNTAGGAIVGAYFNLSGAGSIGTTIASNGTSAGRSITALADNWYLLEQRFTHAAGHTTGLGIQLYAASADNTVSYAGNTSNGLYLWGAHLYRSDLGGMQQNPAMPAGMGSYYPTTVRNMLGWTESFDNAYWTKAGLLAFGSGSTSNAGIAPNGLQTADLLVEDTAAGGHNIYRSFTCISNTPYTWAAYVKPAGRSIVRLVNQATAVIYDVEFSLTGSGSSTNRSGTGTATVTALSDGWYRISATATATAGGTGYWQLNLCSAANTASYTGDGVSGIYLWGAQLSDSASLDTYVPQYGAAVTSAAYYAPRLDFDPVTLAARGLLVEEQRTNLACFTEASASTLGTAAGTTPPSISATTLSGVAVEAITFSTGGSGYNFSRREGANTSISGGWSATSGTSYICSAYIALSRPLTGSEAIEVYQTGTQGGASIVLNASTTNQTTLQRYSASITMSASGTQGTYVFVNSALSSSITVYITRFQAEAGSFATSYIPNGSAVAGATRTADVASVSTQAFPYSATEGALIVSGVRFGGAGYGPLAVPRNTATGLNDRNPDMSIGAGASGGAGSARVDVSSGGSVIAPLGNTSGSFVNGTVYKVGYAYATSDYATVVNGGTANTQVSGGAPPSGINQVDIGQRNSGAFLNGWIRQITMIPRRISNAELISRAS